MPVKASTPSEPFELTEALTHAAFYACLVLVLLRLSINEQLRDTFDMGLPPALGPGPTTTLVLNLACLLPAVLILVRRAIDRGYTLRLRASHLLLILLAIWVAVSVTWANDRFAAAVSASTWCAATAVAWAMGQLVRSWQRLRMVAAVLMGGLLILIAQVGTYYFYEAPELVRQWDATLKEQMLRARNITADSATAVQLDRNVRQGAVLGFYRSPNTAAAVALFGAVVCAGLAVGRVRENRQPVFAVLPAVAAAVAVPLLIITGSRTAQGLAVLAAGMAVLMYAQRRTFVRHRTGTYLALAAAAIGVVTLVAGIGMKTGGLFHDSLTFRWRYWVGSAAMIAARPLTGVGWENFGETYVQYRVPGAIEEIKDPHNLLVKFATETGLPGLVLLIATLGVAAWEVGRRAPALTRTRTGEALRPAAWVVGAFVAAHVATRGFALLDFTELLKLVLFAALLGAAVLVGSVRSLNDFVLEGGRSRWVGGGAVLALLIFLAHNFVDFALFETGPMLMFMATLGACLGIRAGRRRVKRNTPAALASLAVLALLALSFALLIVLPVGLAESHAAAARQLTTENKTDRAAASWRAAIDASPVANAHYALEAGEAYRSSRQPRPREAIAFLSQAVEADPRLLRGWLERARARRSYGLVRDEAELNAIETDYRTALRLDPQAIDARVEYAQFLDSAGRSSRALEEYRAALAMSDRLPAHEIRRLSPANADAVRQRIAALGGGQ